jgi:hypothetical protein
MALQIVKERTSLAGRHWRNVYLCDCGKKFEARGDCVRRGTTTSCGCVRSRVQRERDRTRHGMIGTPTYKSWQNMVSRCTLPSSPSYGRYGARGIKVCKRWRTFENFLADVGVRPEGEYCIGRINHDDDYKPGNARWEKRWNR